MWGYGPESGMMGWGGHGWIGPFNMIIWIVVIVLIVALVVWLFRAVSRNGQYLRRPERQFPALDALEERYARGEINREEYLQKKKDIAG